MEEMDYFVPAQSKHKNTIYHNYEQYTVFQNENFQKIYILRKKHLKLQVFSGKIIISEYAKTPKNFVKDYYNFRILINHCPCL